MIMDYLQKLTTKETWLKPPAPSIGKFFWIMHGVGFFTYLGAFALNIKSLYSYASGDQWWFFSLLLLAVVLPQVPINMFSYWWFRNDCRRPYLSWRMKMAHWLLLAVPLRMVRMGILAKRTKKEEKKVSHWHRFNLAQADLSFLRLLAVYAGSGSQLVVKIYKLLKNWTSVESVLLDITFGVFSAVSLALSTISLCRHCRSHRHDKDELSYASTILQVLYRACFLASRVVALACLFNLGINPGIAVCFAAFAICFIWFRCMKTDFTENWRQELFYHLVMAYLHIFGMFNVKDDPARYRYAFYYTLSFFVELVVYVTYMLMTDGMLTLCLFPGLFLVGLLCHVAEHELFHPGGRLYLQRDMAEWEGQCEDCFEDAREAAIKETQIAADAV